MTKFLLDLPLELQIEVLNYLNLMDVCLLMQVPALEHCILARLPRDEIEINDFRSRTNSMYLDAFSLGNDKHYSDYNNIKYKSKQLRMLSKFLTKVKLSKPINLLSIRGLSSSQIQCLFDGYLHGWENAIFKRVQIAEGYDSFGYERGFVNVPWCKLSLLVKAYLLAAHRKPGFSNIVSEMFLSVRSTGLKNQIAFLAYCFAIKLGISDSTLDFSSMNVPVEVPTLPLRAFEGQTIISMVHKFRNCILDFKSPMHKVPKVFISRSYFKRNPTLFQNLERLSIEMEKQPHLGEVIQKFINLKDLKLDFYAHVAFRLDLKFSQLLKLTILDHEGELILSNLPRLEQLLVKSDPHIGRRIAIQDIPKTIKSLVVSHEKYTMTQNSLLTKNRCYHSLVELNLLKISSLERLSLLKNNCPLIEKLEIGFFDVGDNLLNFASYLPQAIHSVVISSGSFEDTKFDFSGLANLQSLRILTSNFPLSNVVWGTSITSLFICTGQKSIKTDFKIGYGILNQLKHLTLRYLSFENCKLDFGPGSMLKTLSMLFVDTPKDGLCRNLKYLELLKDICGRTGRFNSAAFKDYNNLGTSMDHRYDDSRKRGDKISATFEGEDIYNMENYKILKRAYGLQHDPIIFMSRA